MPLVHGITPLVYGVATRFGYETCAAMWGGEIARAFKLDERVYGLTFEAHTKTRGMGFTPGQGWMMFENQWSNEGQKSDGKLGELIRPGFDEYWALALDASYWSEAPNRTVGTRMDFLDFVRTFHDRESARVSYCKQILRDLQ